MTLTLFPHQKKKKKKNCHGSSVTFFVTDKRLPNLTYYIFIKMFYLHTLLFVVLIFHSKIFFEKLHITSSVGFPVIILSPERHIVKVCTLFFSKITGFWRTWLKSYRQKEKKKKKRLISSKYQHNNKYLYYK